MRDFIYRKLLIILVLFQPVIDIITSYMTMNGYKITVGIITKVFIMALACFYLVFIDKEKRKFNIGFLFFLLLFASLNIYYNMAAIKLYAFTYFNYLFKYIYHLVILYFFIRWYKFYKINLYELRIPLIIIVSTYLISLITDTAYLSYDIYRKGYSGWYSSANELGNILALLFPVIIYNAFHNKDGIKFDTALVVITSFCLLMIGTKVGLFGFYLTTLSYLILRIIFIKRLKLDKAFGIILVLVIVVTCFLPKLPTVYNIQVKMREGNGNYLLSDRDKIFEKIMEQYKDAGIVQKIIGVPYYDTTGEINDILIVEQDFFDILFMYGIAGLLLILIIYAGIYVHFIKNYLYYRKRDKYSKKCLAVIFAISIEFTIAFISGHSLLSPSVSTFLCLIIAQSLSFDYQIYHKRKKSILIGTYGDLYKKINQDKYDVYVLGNVPNYKNINKYFDKEWFRFFKNKFMAYLLTRNQKFDYSLCNEKDEFIINYLYYANAKEKYYLNNKNELFKEKNSITNLNK